MDKDKKPEDSKEEKQPAPAGADDKAANTDALGKNSSPDEKSDGKSDSSEKPEGEGADGGGDAQPAKKPNGFKQTLKKIRLYLLIVGLLAVVGGVFAAVTSLNGKKTPPAPSVQSQSLSQGQLKQLAKTNNPSSGQTLTIQGNAIIDGQSLMKSNLDVAGNIQTSGGLTIPNLTLSDSGSLGNATASGLQVSQDATFQGIATVQNGMDVSGPTSISTASIGTLTATKIIMSSNGTIAAAGHVGFTGAFPHRTISFGVLGNGGSASINGSDTNGTVSINTGNNPQPGCFVTIIFNQPWVGAPNILLGPIGLGAGATQHDAQPIVSTTTGNVTGFKICTANTPLPNQAFGFSYLVDNAPN